MPELNSPLLLPCGATLSGRLMKAAMTEGLATPTGQVTDALCRLYRRWSDGGAALLVTGNVMIDGRYLERPGNLVMDERADRAGLARLAAAGTANGNQLWVQINHPGRQCSRLVNGRPVSASAVQLKLLSNFARPRPLRDAEIEDVIEGFARAASIARETGFTGVQVHAAHGYLLSQFLSPLTNRRADKWGGKLENRARLLLKCVRAVRAAVGNDYPVSVKLNSADFQRGGFTAEDSARVARLLETEGIDLLEISGGTYEQPRLLGLAGERNEAEPPRAASTRAREAYFLDYARSMRAAIRTPLAVTGGFRSRAAMRAALRAGDLDVVGLARPLCLDADAPRRLLDGSADALPAYETQLALGRGWLGPASPVAAMRVLNAQVAAAWFYRQIILLARGQPARPDLGPWRALLQHFRDEYRLGLARRRAQWRD